MCLFVLRCLLPIRGHCPLHWEVDYYLKVFILSWYRVLASCFKSFNCFGTYILLSLFPLILLYHYSISIFFLFFFLRNQYMSLISTYSLFYHNSAIIKTFVISKFNHLFISLPSPAPTTIKEISNILYKFLWGSKTDKIARKQIYKEHIEGGLKMIDLQNFILAIKSTWIRRLLVDQNAPWVHLAAYILGPLNYITNFGPYWYNTLPLKVKNPFWLDVLKAWKNITETEFEKHTLDILYTPLWFNNKIGQPALYYPKWYQKGILFVGDLLDTKGSFCTFNELKKNFKLDSVNILEYYTIKKICTDIYKQMWLFQSDQTNRSRQISPFEYSIEEQERRF